MTTKIELLCWRCTRKLLELHTLEGIVVPPGVVLELPCGRCRALSRVELGRMASSETNVTIARSK